MARTNLTRLGRAVGQALKGRNAAALNATRPSGFSQGPQITYGASRLAHASLSTSSRLAKPIPPEALKTAKPAELTPSEYHELADQYMDDILAKFEEEQDENGEIDVEYSAGVMNIKFPHGSYVINKQPPNKQIWLSSPLSGPKRYDWVVLSEGQDSKQDTATGGWVYLRDGTFLTDLLEEETGIRITTDGTMG